MQATIGASLYVIYFLVSWILLSKLFEKYQRPGFHKWPFHLFLLLYPIAVALCLAYVLNLSAFESLRTSFEPSLIDLCRELSPCFLFVHFGLWFYGVWSLLYKKEILIPDSNSSLPLRMKSASDFAFYFAFAGLLGFVCLPWALLA